MNLKHLGVRPRLPLFVVALLVFGVALFGQSMVLYAVEPGATAEESLAMVELQVRPASEEALLAVLHVGGMAPAQQAQLQMVAHLTTTAGQEAIRLQPLNRADEFGVPAPQQGAATTLTVHLRLGDAQRTIALDLVSLWRFYTASRADGRAQMPADAAPTMATQAADDGSPDLSIFKYQSDSAPPYAGGQTSYSIYWYNGNGTAREVVLTDFLPISTTYVSSSHEVFYPANQQNPFPVTAQNGQVSWQMGVLPPFSRGYMFITTALAPTLAPNTVLTNTAAIASSNDPDPLNNRANTVAQVAPPSPDMEINKWLSGQLTPAGQAIYNVYWRNLGSQPATNVIITDTLPMSMSYVSQTGYAYAPNYTTTIVTPTVTGNVVAWHLGTVAPGWVGLFRMTVAIAPEVAAGTVVTNTAHTLPASGEIYLLNNQDLITNTIVAPSPELVIYKELADDEALYPGAESRYELSVVNNGSWTADEVIITDTLPLSMSYVSYSGYTLNPEYTPLTVEPTINGTMISWNIGQLLPNGAVYLFPSVRLAADVAPGTILTNRAAVRIVPGETRTNDNRTEVNNVVLTPKPDMYVGKSGDDAYQGGDVTYQIYWGNGGADTATNVVITDTLPAGLTIVDIYGYKYTPEYTTTVPTAIINGQKISWNLGNVEPGWSGNFHVITRLPATLTVGAVVTNTVVVRPVANEENTNNNAAIDTRTVLTPTPNLSLDKALPGSLAIGSEVTYELAYNNDSASPAPQTILTDTLPAGMTFRRAEWRPSNNVALSTPITPTINGRTLSFVLGTIPGRYKPGYYGTFYITTYLADNVATSRSLTNRAALVTPFETDASDNNATHTGTTVAATRDLYVYTDLNSGAPVVGESYQYYIQLSNYGNAAVTGVTLTNTLPVSTTFVRATESNGNPLPPPTITTNANGRQVLVWRIGTVPGQYTPGYERYLYVTVALHPAVLPGTALVNEVTAWGDQVELPNNYQNFHSDFQSALAATRDLQVTKSFDNEQFVTPGTQVRFDLVTRNTGNATAHNVIITDTLPAGLTYDFTGGLDGWSTTVIGNQIIFTRTTVPGSYYDSWYIYATVANSVTANTNLTNTITIGSADADDNPANNRATAVATGDVVVNGLALTKTIYAVANAYLPGTRVTWQLHYTNTGTIGETVVVTDTLPAGLTYDDTLSWADSCCWIRQRAGNVVTWRRTGPLPAGETGQLYISGIIANNANPFSELVNQAIMAAVDDQTLKATSAHTITVGGAAISVTPNPFDMGNSYPGFANTQLLTVRNVGAAPLLISSITTSSPLLTVVPVTLTLAANRSTTISVTLTPTATGAFNGNLYFASNDFLQPTYVTPVSSTVLLPPTLHVDPLAVQAFVDAGAVATVTLQISNTGSSELQWELLSESGVITDPNASGYALLTSKEARGPRFAWVDIAATGTEITGLGDDNFGGPYPIGFEFPYFDQRYTQFYVASNGYIGFGPPTNYGSRFNRTIPSTDDAPHNMIAWLWDDLLASDSTVYYQLIGGDLVIQFSDYRWWCCSQRITAQIILKANGNILIQYLTVDANAPVTEAVIGIENQSGSAGLQAAFRQDFVEEQLAVLFARQPDWLRVNPTRGATASAAVSAVVVTLDATQLTDGVYTSTLFIQSNDPVHPRVTLPVTFAVGGEPLARLDPPTLTFANAFVGYPTTRQLRIHNDGTGPLVISDISINRPTLQVTPATLTVPLGASRVVSVTYQPTTMETLTATLTISTNQPLTPLLTLPVTGQTLAPPVVAVAPTAITETLASGDVRDGQLTISNTGSSPLQWRLEISRSHTSDLLQPSNRTVGIVGWYADVLYNSLIADNALSAYSFTDLGDNWTAATLQPYDLILVDEDDGGITAIEAAALRSYGANHPVILGMDDVVALATNVRNDLYAIFGVTNAQNADFTFGSLSSHPIAEGLTPISAVGGDNDYFQSAGAEWVVRDPAGRSFVLAYEGASRAVIMGENLSSWYDASPALVHNALFWAGAAWLSGAPDSGTIAPGGSANVLLTLDATNLVSGAYGANLYVLSNDPATPRVTIPVTLRVTGAPQLLATPNPLVFGASYVNHTQTAQLTIRNTGGDTLGVNRITPNTNALAVTPTNLTVAPFRSQVVTMTLAPTMTGPFSGLLTINSNDPANPLTTVAVSAQVAVAPAIAVTPNSFNVTQDTGLLLTRTLLINNSGQGLLTFDLAVINDIVSVTPVTGTVTPGAQGVISVTFDTRTRGNGFFSGQINVNSNDPDRAQVQIPVNLTVILTPPEVPVNPTPQDGEVNVFINPNLTWQRSPHATTYDLYLWPADETKPVAPTATISQFWWDGNPSYTPPTHLATNRAYRWQVVARNQVGSAPGAEWSFTTETTPDLTVTTVTAPPTAFSGQPLEVRWTVANNGNRGTTVSTWYDLVYLSATPTFDSQTAITLGNAPNPAFLNTGERYQKTATFNLPQGLSGNYYLFILADGYNAMRESNETNNQGRSNVFQITLTPPPDLQVTSVTKPANAFSGDAVTVAWRVSNAGNGATPQNSWHDRLYLSDDITLTLDTDFTLATVYHNGALAAGAFYTAEQVVNLPQTIFGDYYLFVVTDVGNAVFENVLEDNNSSVPGSPIAITLSPPPDLEVTSLDSLTNVASGQQLTVNWEVTNNGAGDPFESFWQDRLYLSAAPTFTATGALVLDTVAHYGPLAAGSPYTRTRTVMIPNGISGVYYLYVHTDYANQVFEFTGDANNVRRSAALQISLTPSPELQVTAVTTPTSAAAGAPVAIRWTVRNQGAATPATVWQDKLYLSANSVWNGEGLLLGAFARPHPLTGGGAYDQARTVVIPGHVRAGNYYIHVVTDAEDVIYEHNAENNNSNRSARFPVTARPATDLALMALTGATAGNSGEPTTLRWTVQNGGVITTQATSWRDTAYLSTDTVLSTTTDIVLGEWVRSGALAANATYTRSETPLLPNGLSGAYYLFLVVDSQNNVDDNHRANNVTAVTTPISITLSPSPDLLPTASNPPATALSGQPLAVGWRVTNQGAAPATGLWYDAIYLSLNPVVDANDRRLLSAARVSDLAVNASYNQSTTITLPNDFSGQYYLILVSDSRNERYEHNGEANNSLAWPVTITMPPPADLVVTGVTVPADARPGAPVTIDWTLQNQGNFAANGTLCDAVFISADQQWDVNDAFVGEECRTINLASQQKVARQRQVTLPDQQALAQMSAAATPNGALTDELPGVTPGQYYAIVRTDIRNNIPESDETNNAGASAQTLLADVEALTLDTPVTGTLGAGKAIYYRVEVPPGATLLLTFDSSSTTAANELYVRAGAAPSRNNFDFSYSDAVAPDQRIIVPFTRAGNYYILAYGANVPGTPSSFTLVAKALAFSIQSVATQRVGNVGASTIEIRGAKFTRNTHFELIGNDGVISADSKFLQDNSRGYATFNLAGRSPGVYALRAIDPTTGLTATLDNAVTVTPGVGAQIEARIVGPSDIRANQRYAVMIQYGNSGDADAVAPLLLLDNPNDYLVGFDPAAMVSGNIQLLGISQTGPAGILRAGEQRNIPLYFQSQTVSPNFNLYTILPDNADPIDWMAFAAAVRTPEITDEVWEPGWAQVQARVGSTWGGYDLALAEVATFLGGRGQRTYDVHTLFTELIRQAFGQSPLMLSGQIINGDTGQPVDSAKVIARREISPTGAVIQTALTTQAGDFTLDGLTPGVYALFVEGYYFDTTPSYTVTAGVDITGLTLYAQPVISSTVVDEVFEPSDSSPTLAMDGNGNVHMAWQRDEQLWHALYQSAIWTDTAPISQAIGTEPALAFIPDPTSSGTLALSWQTGFGNDAKISYSTATLSAAGDTTWAQPTSLTLDGYGDTAPALIATANRDLLLLWLQRDWNNPDDSDLYYQTVPVTTTQAVAILRSSDASQPDTLLLVEAENIPQEEVFKILAENEALFSAAAQSGQHCVGVDIREGQSLPGWVPLIGGKYEFVVTANACGSIGCTLSLEGGVETAVTFSDYVEGAGGGNVSAEWEANKETCQYDFNKAALQLSAGATGKIPVWKPPVKIPKVTIEVGAQVSGEVSGNVEWEAANFPGLPSGGNVELTAGVGPYGILRIGPDKDPWAEGEVTGTGSVTGRYTPPKKFEFAGWCLELSASASAWVLSYEWSEEWGPCGNAARLTRGQGMSSRTLPNGSFRIESSQMLDDVPVNSNLTVRVNPLIGTGAVYEGTPVLANTIQSDLRNDGHPSVARSDSGEVLVAWTKDSTQPEVAVGSAVVVAQLTGAGWTTPTVVHPAFHFNVGPELLFDAAGVPMLLWSSAPATVTLQSSVESVLQAIENSDIYLSRRVAGMWTPPTPFVQLPGTDAEISAAASDGGQIVVAWLNKQQTTETLYTIFWDGTTWSTPIAIPVTGAVRSLDVIYQGATPLLVWEQETATAVEQRTASTIFYTTWDGITWSTAVAIPKPVLPTQKAARVEETGINQRFAARVGLPTPPEDCCEKCEEGDTSPECDDPPQPPPPPPPPPPDDPSEPYDPPVRFPRDPNDILGPQGYGDARWVAQTTLMDYRIRFENDESIATAPAQRVTIEQTLDGDLDPRRFRLGAFGFGDYLFDVPENRSFYNARLGPLTIVSRTYYVDVTAGIDIITGKAFWIFQSIDPATGAPPTDALAGFLPPDFNNGEGQGFVTYNVRPKTSAATDARIDAQARIVFDDQDPIDTPPIFNTIDADPPSSTMTALPAQTTATDVVLNWTSSDAANGSGLAGVDLYVARDDAAFALWQSNIAETATVFTGEQGHRYGFFALAKDNAGNREATKAAAETATFIYLPGIPYTMTLAATPNQIVANGSATSTVVATVVDAVNTPIAGAVVTFTASQGTVVPLTAMTNGSGSVTATFTAGAGVGLAAVQANVGAISRTTTISLTAGAPTTITLTVTPTALTANGNSMATVTARVVDALLNPIAGKSIVFTGTLGSVTPLTQTLDAAGLATTTFTAGTIPGVATITAQIEGITETVQIVLAAAHFSTTITTQDTGIVLGWPAGLGFGEYAIHRSPMPFFTPGADTLLATAPATAVSYHDPNTAARLNGGYYYLVRGVGGGVVDSNQVGVINYRLNNVGNQYSLIALPFLPDGVTNAATLASYIGNVSALLKWNPATQSFQFFATPNAGDNFTLTQGAALFVKVNSGGPTLMTLTGSVTSSQHTLTPGGFNFVSLPLQKGNLTDAAALAADLTAVQSLLAWNETTQAFRFFAPPTNGDNFAVWPGMPFIVSMTANGPTHWPIDLTAAAPPSNTGGQPSLVDLTLITPAAYNAEEHNAASRSTLYLPLIKRE